MEKVEVKEEKKKKKKGRLTKEEKLQLAKERQLVLRKEHLEREIKHGALNSERYRRAWREMMMRIKMPTIKEDVETAWRSFDRMLDVKDHSIRLLSNAIEEAENQHTLATKGHNEVIASLFNIYNMRTIIITNIYEDKIKIALSDADIETYLIESNLGSSEAHLRLVIAGVQARLDEMLSNVTSKTISKVDAFASDKMNARRLAAARLENQLNGLWGDLRRIVSNYNRNTKDRRKTYEVIRTKDEKAREEINEQYIRSAVLSEAIRKLRDKIAVYKTNSKKRIDEIIEEQNFLHTSYWTIKNRFLSEQKVDKTQLMAMTIQFNFAEKQLKRLDHKIQRLLVFLQVCQKYETLGEKIQTYINTGNGSPRRIFTTFEWEQGVEIMNDFQDLNNFWRRIGMVKVAMEELKLEKEELQGEAKNLQAKLKRYLSKEALSN